MILPILFITAYVTNADSNMVCDERYCLHAVQPLQHMNSFEDASAACSSSMAWLLEIYDENVWKLLQTLKNQMLNVDWKKGSLMGMKISDKGWQWTNNKLYDGPTNTISFKTINNQDDLNKVVRATLTSGNDIQYDATDIYSYSNYVICSKEKTASICLGWEYNGLCFYAIWISNKWYQAHNMCIQNQSSMATFDNVPWNKEYCSKLLTNNILPNLTISYWIGLSRNTWKWLHSDTFVTYNKWVNIDMNKMYTYVDNDGSWISEDWQNVSNCVLVCMSNSKVSTTKSTVQDVDKNSSPSSSTTSVAIVDHPYALSIGAKAGIGVGVSMLLIIIIISGVLGFKHFQFKKAFQRKKSETATDPEDAYSVVANKNRQTISPDVTSHQLEYADLDFKKYFEDNIKSANY